MQASETTGPAVDANAHVAGGGRSLLVAQVLKFVLRAASAMVLARLLTPRDYGVFAMAAVIQGLFYMIRDLGAGTATRRPGLTREKFDALFRFGLFGGTFVGCLCALVGPAAGRFYDEPDLPAMIGVLAFTLTLSGASAPLQALLYREQRISIAAAVDAGGLAAGCAVAIALATAGAGAWALVAMAISNEATVLVLAWRNSPWRPRWRGGAIPRRDLLVFGFQISGHSLSHYVARSCDQIVVGRVSGADALGIYGRGVQAMTLPMQFTVAPFSGWIIAVLARSQSDGDAYRNFFRSALNGLAHLTLPAAAACIAAPELVIETLFGPQWRAAAPAARWLGVALAVQPWLFAHIWLLISVQRTRRLLWLSLLMLAVFAASAILARHAGTAGMAAAVAAASLLTTFVTLPAALVVTPARAADVWTASWRPVLLSVGLTVVFLSWMAASAGRSLPVAIAGLGASACLVAALALGGWKGARMEWRLHFLWRS